MSAFENIPQHVTDSVYRHIADQLLDDWFIHVGNEEEYYIDLRIAQMSDDVTFRKAFNEYYELSPGDVDYFNV